MLKVINGFLVVGLLVAGFVVYSLEYSIKQGERQIARAKNETRKVQETTRLLDAEWSMLTRPERLQRLAEKHLDLEPLRAGQVVSENVLLSRLPERPAANPAEAGNDPIADMLKELGR
jgi:cell division protein FtsL